LIFGDWILFVICILVIGYSDLFRISDFVLRIYPYPLVYLPVPGIILQVFIYGQALAGGQQHAVVKPGDRLLPPPLIVQPEAIFDGRDCLETGGFYRLRRPLRAFSDLNRFRLIQPDNITRTLGFSAGRGLAA
jgi:hypothetical protein